MPDRRFSNDVESFGFLHDPQGRARRGQRIVRLLQRFHRPDVSSLRVLDVGCSAGLIAREVARHVGAVVGLDPELQALRRALGLAGAAGNLDFVCGRGEALPFAAATFDVAICNHVYEHADDPLAMMREVARVLRPEGACYFAGGHTWQLIEPHYRLPLLSLLPRRLAGSIVRASGRGHGYEVRFLPPWRLAELFAPFGAVRPLTTAALRQPELYGLDTGLLRHASARALLRALAPLAAALAPTKLWLLTRPRH